MPHVRVDPVQHPFRPRWPYVRLLQPEEKRRRNNDEKYRQYHEHQRTPGRDRVSHFGNISAGRYRFMSKERICAVKQRICENDSISAGDIFHQQQAVVGEGEMEKLIPLEIRAANIVFFQVDV